jgi:DNA-binding transcriptional LysR family regulator
LRFDDLEAIADAASEGFGLAWLPCWLIRERVRSGALVQVLGDHTGLVIDSHAVWPQTPTLPVRVRLAIDALAAELPLATEM